MNIVWHGQSFFEIVTKDRENKELKVVIDPFDESIGLKVPRTEARILLITHQHSDHSNKKAISGSPFLIEEPGEYEINGVHVKGIPAFHDNIQGKEREDIIVYLIETEDIKICHLGDFGQKELTSEQLDQLGDIDILMIPVGGVYTIDAKGASKIISQIEPKLVIPMHYQIPKLKLKLNSLEQFLKEMGSPAIEPQKKLKLKPFNLPKEKMEIAVLEPC
jgi:L-ascorbate metabolism protein UlaG (beta-lactamase superfamily)